MFRRKDTEANDLPKPAAGGLDDVIVVVEQAVNPYLVLFHDAAGYRAEQVRALRNRLVAMNPDGEPKTLVVTSAVRGEGKTVAAINLAMALAELERQQVVLVDADLRRPSCERYLNLNPDIGLSDVLLGRTTVERALRTAGHRSLMLLGPGTRVDNPAEVLGSAPGEVAEEAVAAGRAPVAGHGRQRHGHVRHRPARLRPGQRQAPRLRPAGG